MRKSMMLFALGVAAAGMTMSPGGTWGAPVDSAAARAVARLTGGLIERVQYRSRRFVSRRAQEAFIDRRMSRMGVEVEDDGTILLPGISTGREGTVIYGAPRSRTSHGGRIGVWSGGSGGRLGVHQPGSGGRLTGGVPGHRSR